MARFTTAGGSGNGIPGAPGTNGADGKDSLFLGTWNSVTEFLAAYQGGPTGLADGDWWAFVKDNANPNKIYVVREDPNSATGWVIDDNEHFVLPAGADGADGAQGPQGEVGPSPFNYQGDFNYGVTYAGNDAVTFQGGLWKLNNFIGAAGYAPTPGQWTLIIPAATPGADGEDGTNGNDGAQGPQGDPGSPGIVYLGNYVSGNGYIANLAVVKGSDNNLYIATSSGGLGDPIGNSAEWSIFLPKGADGAPGTTFTGYYNEIHVSQADGNDTTGNGDLLTPVASITKALTLITAQRKTIIVHPGGYTESPTIVNTNTTISTTELTGGGTVLYGTLTIGSTGSGSRISGFSMNNLAITGTAQAYVSNCTINDNLTKSSSGYVEIINTEMQCTAGINISGSGLMIINGNKNAGISVSNAGAILIVKDCNSVVTPSASAGTLNLVNCIITALGSNAVTITGASTVLTLANCEIITQAGNNVAPISVAGIYSIFNTVYDKPGSTLTGTSTNSIDYFQYINADKFITQGGTSTQFVKGDGSLDSTGATGTFTSQDNKTVTVTNGIITSII